ncbi:hemogen-like protein [Corchorus capsularis]|uniref:Hemogen-like protein n=1 Tax=Corchorus capsularis TaxID=210143 RepID=A0A1R3FYA7_COCAP|nr:hemogen-like protein [Corchorus capsularis]
MDINSGTIKSPHKQRRCNLPFATVKSPEINPEIQEPTPPFLILLYSDRNPERLPSKSLKSKNPKHHIPTPTTAADDETSNPNATDLKATPHKSPQTI